MSHCDVAIIGAGPYGLSAAAHLRTIPGLEIRVLGAPMSFWAGTMPSGMLLRSPWAASHIGDPAGTLTLNHYRTATNGKFGEPVPLADFVNYGKWFQCQIVPDLDRRAVTAISAGANGFELRLSDGDRIESRRVVVAAGIQPFAHRPPQFEGLPSPLVSHTSEHTDLRAFTDKKVLVAGGGQSALESAALLHEAGAHPELIVRAASLRFLRKHQWLHELGPLSRLLYAKTDVGPIGVSHIVARPDCFKLLSRDLQDKLAIRSIRPAGSRNLVVRLADVKKTIGRGIVSASVSKNRVRVELDDGTFREADHLLLGTGYRVDISGYSFLSNGILQRIERVNGYPRLNAGFESTVPGLHILGAPASWSFGPLMRFVAGTPFAGSTLSNWLRRRPSVA